MDPEKLTRVFVGNEGFDRRYALGFCQALRLNDGVAFRHIRILTDQLGF